MSTEHIEEPAPAQETSQTTALAVVPEKEPSTMSEATPCGVLTLVHDG